jgi:hypothetical protein
MIIYKGYKLERAKERNNDIRYSNFVTSNNFVFRVSLFRSFKDISQPDRYISISNLINKKTLLL